MSNTEIAAVGIVGRGVGRAVGGVMTVARRGGAAVGAGTAAGSGLAAVVVVVGAPPMARTDATSIVAGGCVEAGDDGATFSEDVTNEPAPSATSTAAPATLATVAHRRACVARGFSPT